MSNYSVDLQTYKALNFYNHNGAKSSQEMADLHTYSKKMDELCPHFPSCIPEPLRSFSSSDIKDIYEKGYEMIGKIRCSNLIQ